MVTLIFFVLCLLLLNQRRKLKRLRAELHRVESMLAVFMEDDAPAPKQPEPPPEREPAPLRRNSNVVPFRRAG